jgi:RNA polymerase sigma factor (sigma-70 family)
MSEAVALARARDGDDVSFGALYEQHVGTARRLARSLVADHSDADDVVAEVFAATLAALRRGRGPVEDFRGYVLTSVRRECQRAWRIGARQRPGGDVVIDLAAARANQRDEFASRDEGEIVQEALAALPPRMQRVLWLTEVEGLAHAEIARQLRTTSANVAQLARRARQELGAQYLDAHLPTPDGPLPSACEAPRRVLADVVRGTASGRAERIVADHIATCAACSEAAAALRVVNGRLRSGHVLVLLPAVTITRPARAGLLARLLAWISGPAPLTSVVASVAVATLAVPALHPPRIPPVVAAAPIAPEVVAESAPAADPSPEPDADPRSAGPSSSADVESSVTEPADAAAVPAPLVEPTATDMTPTSVAPQPGDSPAAASPPAASAPDTEAAGPTAPPVGPLPDLTDGLADTVNGLTIDDPIVGVVSDVLEVVPEVGVALSVPPTSVLGPVALPPVSVDVGAGGGGLHVDAGAGPAEIGVAADDNSLQVELPSVPELTGALTAPVPGLLHGLPAVGDLLGP